MAEIYRSLPEEFRPAIRASRYKAQALVVLHKVPENPSVVQKESSVSSVYPSFSLQARSVVVSGEYAQAKVASRVSVVVSAKAVVVESSSLLEVQELNLEEMEAEEAFWGHR